MRIDKSESNVAIMAELGSRLRTMRLDYDWTQAQMAERSGVSQKTVARLEKGEDVQLSALIRILRAMDALSLLNLAIPEPKPRPSSYLEKKPPRMRASKTRKRSQSEVSAGAASADAASAGAALAGAASAGAAPISAADAFGSVNSPSYASSIPSVPQSIYGLVSAPAPSPTWKWGDEQ